MEVLKDNLFNRIFRRRKLQKQHDEKIRLESTVKKIDLYMPKMQECEDMTKMLHLHREMWKENLYGIEADTTVYQLMLYQYRFVLTSNMQLIRQQAVDRLKELKT